jgi:hypothetical protein
MAKNNWFKKLVNDPAFWEWANRKDEENKKNGVYGKIVLKTREELEAWWNEVNKDEE